MDKIDYIELKIALARAEKKVIKIKSALSKGYINFIRETHPEYLEKIQALFKYPITRIIAKEYLDERAGWCRTVEITTESIHNNEPIIESREYVVDTGNEWYGNDDDETDFIYEVSDDIIESLKTIYLEFPYLITEYMG